MNGYSNNGFTQSLNGILSLTDGLGTTIENGTITTGDISGDDITSSTVTTTSLKSTSQEITGNLIVDGTTTFAGIITSNNTTDTTSLLNDVYSLKILGGVLINKNLYCTDVMSDNVVSGNIGCGNLNSSNNISCIDLISDTIKCNTLNILEIENHYKNKICGYLNIGIAPYFKIPLTTSLYNLNDGDIINFNLETLLINANNNSLFILPYYIITFYNNENIIFISDNSSGLYPLLYEIIIFSPAVVCTKIIITYKNIII